MDKKNTIIGLTLIAVAFGLVIYQGQVAQDTAREQDQSTQAERELTGETSPQTQSQAPAVADAAASQPQSAFPAEPQGGGIFKKIEESIEPASTQERSEEQEYVLENDYVRVTFSTWGGSIKHVAFVHRQANGALEYPATLDSEQPYRFNAGAQLPALAISLDTDRDGAPEEYAPDYKLESKDESTILFSYTDPQGGIIYRGYAIDKLNEEGNYTFPDPYVILHETRFVNESGSDLNLSRLWVNVGTAPPTEGDTMQEFLNFGYYDGEDTDFLKMSKFIGSKGFFLGIGSSTGRPVIEEKVQPLIWASVKNQFFAAVLTPDLPGKGIYAKPVDLSAILGIENPRMQQGLTGSIEFNLGRLPAGGEQLLGMQYYVGPKEYTRLRELGKDQSAVMQFGFFSFISKGLLLALIWIHDIVVYVSPTWAWGWAIILLTVLIKGILWPLTQVQVKSAKRMQRIQKPLQELREKYKDDQQEMMKKQMELFRQHHVNPAAGCLPLLVQMPIFFGLFFMLRSASEVRFAPFLWIQDLALPDTIATIGGFPINILPLFMTAAMVVQMRMTPTPTTDNFQRKIFQFMPIIFLVFCYNFPSGLVLYWTCQNLISVFQQWLTNRRPDEYFDAKPRDPSKETFMEKMQRIKEEQERNRAGNSAGPRGPKTTPSKKKRKK